MCARASLYGRLLEQPGPAWIIKTETMARKIKHIREDVLFEFVNNEPGGAKRFADTAIAVLPYSAFKTLTEALDLEDEVQRIKRKEARS